MENFELLQQVIDEGENIVFFGGAGVSCESGIPDFRSADGLYNQKYKFPPEVIVSNSFFTYRTEDFYEFYREKMLYPKAKPNAAHKYLAELEKRGKLTAVITQNIDGLHQAAGSKNVLELHGSVHRNHCTSCGRFFSLKTVAEAEGVPHCPCGGIIKPDVVLYEEPLSDNVTRRAIEAISKADVLIIGGTSLSVYPAAGFVNFFKGAKTVVIDKNISPRVTANRLHICEPIAELFSKLR